MRPEFEARANIAVNPCNDPSDQTSGIARRIDLPRPMIDVVAETAVQDVRQRLRTAKEPKLCRAHSLSNGHLGQWPLERH